MTDKSWQFQKGHPKLPGCGRPKGSLDKQWHDLKWWYGLILDNHEKLSPVQKVELGLKGLSLLVSKLPNIPATPDESVQRVIDVKGELEQAENNDNTKPGDNSVRVETGETKV